MPDIGLMCLVYPGDSEKKENVLQNLQHLSRNYYRDPNSLCTTWVYLTPSNSGTYNDIIKSYKAPNIVGGFEIYTDKSALSKQQKTQIFQDYHAKAEKEELYERPESLVAVYPAGGYVAREKMENGGRGVFVLTAWATMVDTGESKTRFLKGMSDYADWIKENEPGTLTYCVFTRPKEPETVMIFERFASREAFREHVRADEGARRYNEIKDCIKKIRVQQWDEVDESFVGGLTDQTSAKL